MAEIIPSPASTENDAWSIDKAVDWLLSEGRFLSDLNLIAEGVGKRLHDDGAPVSRFRVAMRTLHPLITAVSGIWERDIISTEPVAARHGLESSPAYVGSPMAFVAESGEPFRKRLTERLTDSDHRVLHELKERGTTDYLCFPLKFTSNLGGLVTIATDRDIGFSDTDIEKFLAFAKPMSVVMEVLNQEQTAKAVAEAYLGSRTGRRVLDGRITRGHVETINAAILVGDIKNWTAMSAQLSPEDVLHLANRYFDIMASAINRHGGEILKFIGDSVLAIFEAGTDTQSATRACERAVAAAQRALTVDTAADGEMPFEFGIGLDFGEVLYGNVGSPERIDFTVLGPHVNIAFRIERLTRELNRPLLYSATVATALLNESDLVVRKALKGHEGEYDIYAPRPDVEDRSILGNSIATT
ncbi:MAG: adenylate/guanylate cyclase domain-containing protein [Pseudomonadota bacterium]